MNLNQQLTEAGVEFTKTDFADMKSHAWYWIEIYPRFVRKPEVLAFMASECWRAIPK